MINFGRRVFSITHNTVNRHGCSSIYKQYNADDLKRNHYKLIGKTIHTGNGKKRFTIIVVLSIKQYRMYYERYKYKENLFTGEKTSGRDTETWQRRVWPCPPQLAYITS